MESVNNELKQIMTRAYSAVKSKADVEHITLREAAFLIGVARVAKVSRIRGFI